MKTYEKIGELMDYASKHPILYNKVANILYKEFGLAGAEIVLLVTYMIGEYRSIADGKEKI